MDPSPDLLTLIRQAQAHDKAALAQLLLLVRNRMKGFFHGRAGPIDSSDLAQDILVKVAQHLPNFEGEAEEQFWAWVTRLARNRWVDEGRRKKRAKRDAIEEPLPQGSSGGVRLPAPGDAPSKIIQRREQEERTRTVLASLSSAEQAVIQMRYFEEKPWPDVALALAKTEAAARKFYQRAIKKWHQACAEDQS
jgi:RNA polymerase sigma-70 factor (ECF subfamily)